MKFNLKNLSPISLSVFYTGISFILFLIVFLITKPCFITEISEDKVNKINYYLLVSYSLMFSILIGLFLILYKVNIKTTDKVTLGFESNIKTSYNPTAYTPLFTD